VAGRFHVTAGLLLDQLSVCFVLLITGVPHHQREQGEHGRQPGQRKGSARTCPFLE
jgi:hypothetical protein